MEEKVEEKEMVEEMLRDLKEHPSETKAGTVIERGGGDTPPMIVSSIVGGGKVQVYDTKTGEMSWVLYNKDTGGMLRQILRIKHSDGTPMFTLRKPDFEPAKGVFKCLLHPNSPDRKHYDEVGLPVCKKSNITSPHMVEKHMKHRHPTAWGTIEKERMDKEKKEDRAFQRGVIDLARGVKTDDIGTPQAPLYVSDKPKVEQKKKQEEKDDSKQTPPPE